MKKNESEKKNHPTMHYFCYIFHSILTRSRYFISQNSHFAFFQSQVDEWIKATDYDSDGKITLEEFKLGVAGTALIEDI